MAQPFAKHRPDLKPGIIVRSRYAAGWYGRVLEVQNRKGQEPLVVVETLCTADGRPHRKSYEKRYSAYWLEIVEGLPERYTALIREVAWGKAARRYRARIQKL